MRRLTVGLPFPQADGCLALGVYETEQGLRLGSQNTTSNAKGDKESIEEGTNGDSV